MVVFLYNFSAEDANGFIDVVQIFFDDVSEDLTARKSNGETSQITYANFFNGLSVGDEIAVFGNDEYNYSFKWSTVYPFATYVRTPVVTPPVFTIDVSTSTTNETLPNESDGSVTITASGGVSPYEYSIDNLNWQSSNIFENLAFGNYIAYVRDSASNLGQDDFVIEQGQYPPAPPVDPPTKDITCLADGELERQAGFKRAIVKTVFGTTPSTLFNGDFEQYDGQNWSQWVRYGGISLSRGQRKIKDGAGNLISIENYTLKFNQAATASKWIEHTAIPIQGGDTAKFSVNIGTTIGTGVTTGVYNYMGLPRPATFKTSYEFRMRIKVGNFYLYNPDGGNNFQWVAQLAVVTVQVDNSKGDVNSFVFNFNMPEVPATGNMVIDIFGFVKTRKITLRIIPGAPEQTFSQNLSEYDPVEIDDVKFEKSSGNKDNDIDSITNISDNLAYYTEPLEPIEIPFGDMYIGDIEKDEFEKLYAIYDQDNNPTTGWIEIGMSGDPVLFGLLLAKNTIQSYQSAYQQFSGALRLKEGAERFSYLDTFSFDINRVAGGKDVDFNSKQFVLLECDIDLKTNIMSNISMREFFTKTAKTNDISVPTSPNTPLPPIVNDPNNNELIGIFTEEYNEVFN